MTEETGALGPQQGKVTGQMSEVKVQARGQ